MFFITSSKFQVPAVFILESFRLRNEIKIRGQWKKLEEISKVKVLEIWPFNF